METILSGAVSDADIVVEAVPERLEIKNQLFRGWPMTHCLIPMLRPGLGVDQHHPQC